MSNPMASSETELDDADQLEDVTPEDPTGEGSNQQPETPPAAFVTREEFAAYQAMMQAEAKRMTQSVTDKVTNRIKNELANLNNVLAFQKQQGLQITPAQEAAMRDEIIRKAYAPDAATSEQDLPEDQDVPLNPIANEIANIMRLEQMPIDTSDPEFTQIDKILQGPPNYAALRQALYAAIDSKKARLARRKDTSKARTIGPGGTSSTPAPGDISKINDSDELYKIAESQLKARRK